MNSKEVKTYIIDIKLFEDTAVYSNALRLISDSRRRHILDIKNKSDQLLSLAAGTLFNICMKENAPFLSLDEVNYNKYNKPFLPDKYHTYFNISHSGTKAVCAFSDKDIGIDIERIKNVSDRLIQKVCSATELTYLLSLPPVKKNEQFIRLWTAKESYMKLVGTGLFCKPSSVDIQLKDCLRPNFEPVKPVFFKEYLLPEYKLTLCGYNSNYLNTIIDKTDVLSNYFDSYSVL